MTTAVELRRTLDLTRAPDEQWNDEMMRLVASQVLKRASTKSEQVYCLAVADALGLNPFIGEIYFIPSKSKDGSGPGLLPYIGRNGLVAKAAERNAYFESETVHANDKFSMRRRQDGTVAVAHSYGSAERGEIVGAYAFLHFRNGDKPAFFYAKLSEYLPSFDQDWKMAASPWGNQRSAMIEKCAMIGAGRKRLNLGNVLIDGEIARFEEQQARGPKQVESVPVEFDFAQFTADPELARRLEDAAGAAGWPPAKCEMVMTGQSTDALERIVAEMEVEANRPATGHVVDAPATPEVPEGDSPSEPTDTAEGGRMADEPPDADVLAPEESERVDTLMARAAQLEQRMMAAPEASDEQAAYSEELDQVNAELEALTNPDQTSLGL